MHTILKKLNSNLKRESRSVILFMDNAGCHPEDLVGKYSNIKIVFLPANTTAVLQPLDLGIIKTFKVYYRKLLLRHVLSQVEECSSAYDVVQSVNILKSIRWIAQAWQMVSSDTVKKCFRKAGILTKQFDVVTRGSDSDGDPFEDLDNSVDVADLQSLIEQVSPTQEHCSVDEFLTANSEIPFCDDIFSDTWESEFFARINDNDESEQLVVSNDDNDDEDDTGDIEIVSKVKSYSEAIKALEDVAFFLEKKGQPDAAIQASKLSNEVVRIHCSVIQSTKQSTLDNFF